MLGVFLMGPLTRHRANLMNIPAMLISTAVCTVLLLPIKAGALDLAWTWLIVIGTAIAMILGWLLGNAEPSPGPTGEQAG